MDYQRGNDRGQISGSDYCQIDAAMQHRYHHR